MAFRSRRPLLALALLTLVAVVMSACGAASTTGKPPVAGAYVALGDSYTSFPGTTATINVVCARSSLNYPHQVAAALKYTLTDVSCSGAKTSDLLRPQKRGVAPQFNALSEKTRLVTVGIGANDDFISSLLFVNCLLVRSGDPTGNPCQRETETRAVAALTALQPQLVATYQAIKARAPKARIIVVGYPQILGSSGTCSKYPIATGDVAYIDALNAKLNAIIRAAASAVGVEYLDVAQASMAHGICSTSPWINGAQSVPGVALAMHPFAAEQQAVAHLLEQRLQSAS